MNGDAVGFCDDDLKIFEANGAAPLPVAFSETHIQHEGAQIGVPPSEKVRLSFCRMEDRDIAELGLSGSKLCSGPDIG